MLFLPYASSPSRAATTCNEGNFTKVVAGSKHTCALLSGGTVTCWGRNYEGQLGRGNTGGKYGTPKTVTGLGSQATALTAGSSHTCAILDDDGNAHNGGPVKCWGRNAYGQLGRGDTGGKYGTPKTVTGLGSQATAITAGSSHTCAILDDDGNAPSGEGLDRFPSLSKA